MAYFAAEHIKLVPAELMDVVKTNGTKYLCEDNGVCVTAYYWLGHWYIAEIEGFR